MLNDSTLVIGRLPLGVLRDKEAELAVLGEATQPFDRSRGTANVTVTRGGHIGILWTLLSNVCCSVCSRM